MCGHMQSITTDSITIPMWTNSKNLCLPVHIKTDSTQKEYVFLNPLHYQLKNNKQRVQFHKKTIMQLQEFDRVVDQWLNHYSARLSRLTFWPTLSAQKKKKKVPYLHFPLLSDRRRCNERVTSVTEDFVLKPKMQMRKQHHSACDALV